jgi:hypothetical protein
MEGIHFLFFFFCVRQTAGQAAVVTGAMGLFCMDIFGRGLWNLGFSSAVIVELEDDTYSWCLPSFAYLSHRVA